METIAVGVDGTGAGESAVIWAARTAQPPQARLVLVHCVQDDRGGEFPAGRSTRALQEELQEAEDRGREALAVAGRLARLASRPHPPVEALSWRSAREELLAVAQTSALVVLGTAGHGSTRGRGRSGNSVVGSTTRFLLDRSPCPVALVPSGEPVPVAGGVVVGVDGSQASAEAVDLAATYAQASGADLLLVGVVSLESPGVPSRPAQYLRRLEVVQKHRRRELDDALARVVAAHPHLGASARVVEGPFASQALLEASSGADVIVVAHRVHGAFLFAVLGSTARTLLRRSPIPLVVVPPTTGSAHDPGTRPRTGEPAPG